MPIVVNGVAPIIQNSEPVIPLEPANVNTAQQISNSETVANHQIQPQVSMNTYNVEVKPNFPQQKVTEGSYVIGGGWGDLLGDVEIKPKGSVVVTLDGPQGAGKTTAMFPLINELARNYTVLFLSLEEHPESKLFKKKRDKYIEPGNLNNVTFKGELPPKTANLKKWLQELSKQYDAIFIDSMTKIMKRDRKLDMDEDIRQAVDGKFFFLIYQQTADGKMRGGSEAAFDGDVILKIMKHEDDFSKNYIYPDKHRYTEIDISKLKLGVVTQQLMPTYGYGSVQVMAT